jgi:SPP1 family predicted phage head-tail adaptor
MAIGAYRHVVTFQTPTTAPDGDGGTIDTWVDLAPPWDVSITPATVRDLERQTGGTIIATATHVIRGRYRADVDVDDQMIFDGRTFRITGVSTPDERKLEILLFAAETV